MGILDKPLIRDEIIRIRTQRLYRKRKKNRRKNKKRVRFVIPNYAVYIKSKEWREKCKAYYKRHKKRCFACGETTHIHMHHLNYVNLGKEEDGDIIPLCVLCHTAYHDGYGVHRDMTRTTIEFISDVRVYYNYDGTTDEHRL